MCFAPERTLELAKRKITWIARAVILLHSCNFTTVEFYVYAIPSVSWDIIIHKNSISVCANLQALAAVST